VEGVTIRRQGDVPLRIGGDHVLLGRIVEVPGSLPEVNRVDVLEGAAPDLADDGALLAERHLYDHFGMEPGSTIEVLADGQWAPTIVAGSAASAEYLWPARSRQDVLTSQDDFGIVFASTAAFDALAGESDEQVLVRFGPATCRQLTDDLTADAVGAGATFVEPRDENASHAALSEDLSGFGELSFLFPVLFLGAAGMATYILLGRLVRSQQMAIATLRANGLSARRVLTHYVVQGRPRPRSPD
jgi:putative ABC transport system permease protein